MAPRSWAQTRTKVGQAVRVRRRFFLIGIEILGVLAVVMAARWGSAHPVATLNGTLPTPPTGRAGLLVWIERRSDGDHLLLQRGRRAPQAVLSGAFLGGVAVTGDRIFTSVAQAQGGVQLVSIDAANGAPTPITTLSTPATNLLADDEWIVGFTGSDPALPSVAFVVAGGASTAIWAQPRKGGAPSVLATMFSASKQNIELLGLTSGTLYWIERGRAAGRETTVIHRSTLPHGKTETLVTEIGRQQAVLGGNKLAWTCASREAAQPDQFRAVKVRTLTEPSEWVVADWLSQDVRLLSSDNAFYAQEAETLWLLGERRGEQRIVYATSSGSTQPAIIGGSEYLFESGDESRLVARSLTWQGKLCAAFGW